MLIKILVQFVVYQNNPETCNLHNLKRLDHYLFKNHKIQLSEIYVHVLGFRDHVPASLFTALLNEVEILYI